VLLTKLSTKLLLPVPVEVPL